MPDSPAEQGARFFWFETDAAGKEFKETTVDPAIFDACVGEYELAPGLRSDLLSFGHRVSTLGRFAREETRICYRCLGISQKADGAPWRN